MLAVLGGNLIGDVAPEIVLARQNVRRRHVGRVDLMFEAGFIDLKRNRHMEDRPAMLNRHDPARTETFSVAAAVDLVEDRNPRIARQQEIGVKRVTDPILNRARRRNQRLAQDLAAENTLRAVLAGSIRGRC